MRAIPKCNIWVKGTENWGFEILDMTKLLTLVFRLKPNLIDKRLNLHLKEIAELNGCKKHTSKNENFGSSSILSI